MRLASNHDAHGCQIDAEASFQILLRWEQTDIVNPDPLPNYQMDYFIAFIFHIFKVFFYCYNLHIHAIMNLLVETNESLQIIK